MFQIDKLQDMLQFAILFLLQNQIVIKYIGIHTSILLSFAADKISR